MIHLAKHQYADQGKNAANAADTITETLCGLRLINNPQPAVTKAWELLGFRYDIANGIGGGRCKACIAILHEPKRT